MQVRVQQRTFDARLVERVCDCAEAIFTSDAASPTEIAWRLEQMPDAVVHWCESESEFMGFKIGYASRRTRLYSWVGGVHHAYRRRGVARALMQAQHAWAKDRGYTSVETGTMHQNLAMLTLNLQSGFKVIGTYTRAGKTRVLMTKRL